MNRIDKEILRLIIAAIVSIFVSYHTTKFIEKLGKERSETIQNITKNDQ